MKNSLLLLLLLLLFTGCASFQISTLNHDPIYSIEGSDAEITFINNEFELQRLLRDDFNFRYDFAQYAKSQPISFDWNNRILRNSRFNRYNYNNRYSWSNGWGYSSYWNRDQMWDDWLWGYQYGNGIGWSYSWNNNSWSSNSWNSPYGWNNYYGWNNRYRRSNVAYHTNRRSSVSQQNRRAHASMIHSTIPKITVSPTRNKRTISTTPTLTRTPKVRLNNATPRRNNSIVRVKTRTTPTRTNTTTRRINSKRKN